MTVYGLGRNGALALAAATLTGAPAFAQQAPLPSRQEVTPPTPDTRGNSRVEVDSRAAFERPPCPFAGSTLRLTVNQVNFTQPDGSPLQPGLARSLAGVAAPPGEQPITAVCDLRDRANAALRAGGWVASVQIPAQEINGGVIAFQVVAARIVEMRVRGSAGPYQALLGDRIRQLQASDPLNEREAERLLLLASDTPGLDVQLSLRPAGGTQGAVIGELNIIYRRFSVLANAQNFNSRLLGRETGYVRAELYGLTGLADLTYLGLSSTAQFREQRIVQVGHVLGLDASGTRLGGRFTYAWSRPDLRPLDYRTNTLIAGVDLTRPLIRSLRGNVGARLGFDYINQLSFVRSGETKVPLTTDRLRIGFVGLDADYVSVRDDGTTALAATASLELRRGFGLFGASDRGFTNGRLTSRIDGSARATVARLGAEVAVGLGRVFTIAAQTQVQWANKPLLSYEEYSVGNLSIGRGYDPGATSGDRAVGGRAELRAELPIAAAVGTQLFGFYDAVRLQNLDANASVGERRRTLQSFGGGARLSLPGSVVLEVMYAHPRDRATPFDERRPGDRLLVSLTAQFRDRAR